MTTPLIGEQPAYPGGISATLKASDDAVPTQIGLSKRELFAAMALQGLMANYDAQVTICRGNDVVGPDPRYHDGNFAEVIAINSVEFADALLAELEKGSK